MIGRVLFTTVLLLLSQVLHAGKATIPPVPSVIVVRTGTPPVIDGNVSPQEWQQSTAITGFCKAGKTMAARQPVAYFTFDDQFLYFAVISKMEKGEVLRANIGKDDHRLICMDDSFEFFYHPAPVKQGLEYYYQILCNSRSAILDNAAEPFGQNNLNWKSHITYRSRVYNNLWFVEAKIPWSSYNVKPEDLKKQGQCMNICRNGWHSATSWSWTMKFANLGRAGNVAFETDIPAIKLWNVKALLEGEAKITGKIDNLTKRDASIKIMLDIDGKKIEKTVDVKKGESTEWELDAGKVGNKKFSAGIRIVDNQSGKVYLSQTIPVDTNVKKKVCTTPPPPVRLSAGFSRISNAVNSTFDIYHFPQKDQVREAILQIFEEKDGKLREVGLKKIAAFPKGIAESLIYLNSDYQPGQEGKYVARLTLYDNKDNKLFTEDKELLVKRFEWENNSIGISDKVLPPFTPLQVDGAQVKCWNRVYTFNGDATLNKVTSGEEVVVPQPMSISANFAGKTIRSKPSARPQIVKSSPHEVILTGNGIIGPDMDYAVRSKIEYDGLVKFSVTLLPRESIRLNDLSVVIPISNSCTRYINATGDYVRKNAICGPLKQDQGRIWSSLQHPNMKVKGNFIPFIWLSNDRNGICWLAETDREWQLDFKKPALDLTREGKIVFLNMNIINKPTVLSRPLSFEFVLQATPVKPMIKGWRKAGIGAGKTSFPQQDNNLIFLWFNWGTPGRWKIDKTYEKVVASANKAGIHSCIYNNWSAFPYSVNSVDRAAVQSFLGDWQDGSVMVKSVQDCVLYYADKLLGEGKIGGIYCDDTWPQASFNVSNQTAYVMENGEVQAGFGLLKQREYAKRVAHMLEKHKKRPGLWIHDTHGLIVPYLAFADISMDGEDHPLSSLRPDFIDQWSFERLRAGAMAGKIGTIPFWLPLVRVPRTKENQQLTAKLSRTMMGPLMLHDYITYYCWASLDNSLVNAIQKAKFDFGIGDDAVTFNPYWDNAKYVKAKPKDVYVSFYRNGKKLLVIAVNKSDKDQTAELTFDFGKLGISNPTVVNAETGEKIALKGNSITRKIPYHDFIMLRIDGK